jgi:hypothetical protein
MDPRLVTATVVVFASASLIGVGIAGAHPVDGAGDRCFPGDGYEFVIGDEVRIGMTLHLSLFTGPGTPSAVGVELAGSTGDGEIVSLRAGVLFDGLTEFEVRTPFEPFSLVYDYSFALPMFSEATGEEIGYEESEPPVSGPVDAADC